MGDILGDRPIIIARELTKLHEQVIRSTGRDTSSLQIPAKGEFTIVLGPFVKPDNEQQTIDEKALSEYFYRMTNFEALSRRQAAAATAKRFGLSPNEVYARIERLKAPRQS